MLSTKLYPWTLKGHQVGQEGEVMTNHVQVTGTGDQERRVSTSSEPENRVRMQRAVRNIGQKPGNPSPVSGTPL